MAFTTLFEVSYHAELIKSCEDKLNYLKKAAAFNHLGEKSIAAKGKVLASQGVAVKYSVKSNFKQPEKSKLLRPQLTDDVVSLSSGLYGINIGNSYKEVLEAFGDPSIQLDLLKGELILGYGRRHWLYFQADKLIKIKNRSEYLSQTMLNEIPLIEFFDDFSWRINNKISHGDSLKKIRETFNTKTPLNAQHQLFINEKNNTLVLNFVFVKNMETLKREYSLDDFEIYKSDYQTKEIDIKDLQESQHWAIEGAYKRLQQEKAIDWKNLSQQLGKPVGQITLTADSSLFIYNQHLLINIKKSELNSVHFVRSAFLSDKQLYSNDKPWTLGHFKQNSSIKQLKQYFLENNSEYEGEIEMLADDFKLSLYFDDSENSSSLDEAKLIIY